MKCKNQVLMHFSILWWTSETLNRLLLTCIHDWPSKFVSNRRWDQSVRASPAIAKEIATVCSNGWKAQTYIHSLYWPKHISRALAHFLQMTFGKVSEHCEPAVYIQEDSAQQHCNQKELKLFPWLHNSSSGLKLSICHNIHSHTVLWLREKMVLDDCSKYPSGLSHKTEPICSW